MRLMIICIAKTHNKCNNILLKPSETKLTTEKECKKWKLTKQTYRWRNKPKQINESPFIDLIQSKMNTITFINFINIFYMF